MRDITEETEQNIYTHANIIAEVSSDSDSLSWTYAMIIIFTLFYIWNNHSPKNHPQIENKVIQYIHNSVQLKIT